MQTDRATLACASQGYETLKNGSTMAQYVSYVQTPEACMIHLKGEWYMNGLRTSRNLHFKPSRDRFKSQLSLDSLRFSGLAWLFILQPRKHTETIIWHARPLTTTCWRTAQGPIG